MLPRQEQVQYWAPGALSNDTRWRRLDEDDGTLKRILYLSESGRVSTAVDLMRASNVFDINSPCVSSFVL